MIACERGSLGETIWKHITSFIVYLFDTIFLTLHVGKKSSQKKVLIVKVDAIGDFFVWLDSAKEFRKKYPSDEYTLTVVSNHIWSDVAEELPYFDHVWPLDNTQFVTKPLYRWRFLKKINSEQFHTAIQPTYSRNFLLGDSIIRATCAENRIGSRGDLTILFPWQKSISDNWYTTLLPASEKPLMELKRNTEFMSELGIPGTRSIVPTVTFVPPPFFKEKDKQYYVIFPGAGEKGRQWPIANFNKICQQIFQLTGWDGVICGGKGEEFLGHALMDKLSLPFCDLTGKTALKELVSIIARAKIVISNETSAVHIAAATGTPSVCLLGGGHFGRFIPYPPELKGKKILPEPVFYHMDCFLCNWDCIYNVTPEQTKPCIEKISVESVWKTTKKLIRMIN